MRWTDIGFWKIIGLIAYVQQPTAVVFSSAAGIHFGYTGTSHFHERSRSYARSRLSHA